MITQSTMGLLLKYEDLANCDLWNTCKKPDLGMHACNPITGMQRQEDL